MFTWSEDPDQFNHELDIEVSAALGPGEGVVGYYVVQPSDSNGHVQTFIVPSAAPWRCFFDWSPNRVTFGAEDAQRWTFEGDGVPTPGSAHPRMNLWLHNGAVPVANTAVTAVFEELSFTPTRT